LAEELFWSPNGQLLAVVNNNGTIPVWAASTGKELFTLGSRQEEGQFVEPLALVVPSRDGRSLASSSSIGTIKIWQAATGYETRIVEDAPTPINSFAWSPDGKRLAWRNFTGKVQIEDANGKEILTLRARNGLAGRWESTLAWSPDGKRLASSSPGSLEVWDVATGAKILDVPGSWSTQRDVLIWSPDGGRLAAVETPNIPGKNVVEEVKIWDVALDKEARPQRPVVAIPWSGGQLNLLAWNSDGRWIAGARADGGIKVWESATGNEILDLPARNQSAPVTRVQGGLPGRLTVPRMSWNPDGHRLAVVAGEGTIQVHDLVSGKIVLTLDGQAGQIASLAWSPDGKSIASGSSFPERGKVERAGEVKVRDGSTGKEIFSRTLGNSQFYQVTWSPNGAHLASASNSANKAQVRVWEVSNGKEVLNVDWEASDWRLIWAPGGQRLAASALGKARVWELSTGKETLNLPGIPREPYYTDPRTTVAWHSDGMRLAVANNEWSWKIWNATTGKEVFAVGHSVGTHPEGKNLAVLAWSPDGRRLATSTLIDRTVKVWDAATGKILMILPQQNTVLRDIAWDHSGKRLATAGEDGLVKVWDSATGELIRSFEYAFQKKLGESSTKLRGQSLLSWRTGGDQLVIAGEDNAIRVWNTTTGGKATYYGHNAPLSSTAWSPDGKRLASASVDGIIKLWDAATGQEVFSLRVFPTDEQPLGTLAWSPEGWQLALFHPTGSVTVWDAHPGPE
jgi:WD40 repeat protein